MTLKLKDHPSEWRKFALVLAILIGLASWLSYWRGWGPRGLWMAGVAVILLLLGLSLARPRWFRPFYRAWMTAGFHAGRWVGGVLLTLLFLVGVTPLGLLLRLFGKDLLALRRRPDASSFWCEAKDHRRFDRMY